VIQVWDALQEAAAAATSEVDASSVCESRPLTCEVFESTDATPTGDNACGDDATLADSLDGDALALLEPATLASLDCSSQSSWDVVSQSSWDVDFSEEL
jgi:hypothetical protein